MCPYVCINRNLSIGCIETTFIARKNLHRLYVKIIFLRFLVHSIVFFYTFALPNLAVLPLFLNLAF